MKALSSLLFSISIATSIFLSTQETPPLIKGNVVRNAEQLISVTIESEPTTFVNNVNVIFGNLLFSTTDLEVPGPLPLNLVRYYNSDIQGLNWLCGLGMTCNYPQWVRGLSCPKDAEYVKSPVLSPFAIEKKHHRIEPFTKLETALYDVPVPENGLISTKSRAKAIDEAISSHYSAPPRVGGISSFAKGSINLEKYAYALAELEGGSVVRCAARFHFNWKHQDYYLDPETIHKGYTNAGSEISARTNLKNITFRFDGKRDCKDGPIYKGTWVVNLSDGGERYYYSTHEFEDAMNIEQEVKPNGNKLRFEYSKDYPITGQCKRIHATNHSNVHY